MLKYYDVPFYAEAQSGRYSFRKYKYSFSGVNVNELNISKSGVLVGINGNVFRTISIPPKSLVYLGVIEIIYNQIDITKDNNLYCEEKHNFIYDDYDSDLYNFQLAYPQLYEELKDNIISANWKTIK